MDIYMYTYIHAYVAYINTSHTHCAAIHFPTVYNLQRHQRPVPLIPCIHGVGGLNSLVPVEI